MYFRRTETGPSGFEIGCEEAELPVCDGDVVEEHADEYEGVYDFGVMRFCRRDGLV